MGIQVERLVEIWFPDQIFGPPVGCRSAARRVAIFLAIIEGQSGDPLLREWKATNNWPGYSNFWVSLPTSPR
jgi:hypothetical protein